MTPLEAYERTLRRAFPTAPEDRITAAAEMCMDWDASGQRPSFEELVAQGLELAELLANP